MLIKRTVGARGQVVVPKDIREEFGLHAGAELTFDVKGNEIVMKPAKTPEEIVEDFCNTSRKTTIKGGARWIGKVIDEEHEENYGLP